ncbi:MAG: DNA polymerase III subunit gamma/tau [Clostridium sp.]|uniref:DNA polymerase III subunit gamma/tau n=1 Tax=Clostridium sp. TaxID=1506 RepID=UPI0030605493
MGYRALYREWRPKDFNDVVGQPHITTTLKNAIQNDRIAHAYLLCGTRGTGKTSTAKILAKAINCLNPMEGEPCNECEMCKNINKGVAIDVTELDAASHNSVDNIRDIIDDVQYPPQEAKYKVFIIDEVHMLSIGAVNAFLKTLEEPPSRVIFILATTDPQKLPITILSRCQRFDFKRISSENIFLRLKQITDSLLVDIEEDSLRLLSRMCDGAMRDALSILDQAISINNKVTYDDLVDMLGITTNDSMVSIVDFIISRDTENCIRVVSKLIFDGKDVSILIRDLITHMRNILMVSVSNNLEDVLDMSIENIEGIRNQSTRIRVEEIMRCISILQEAEDNAKGTKQARIYLELAIIKMCKIKYDTSIETVLSRLNMLEEKISSGNITVQGAISEIKQINPEIGNKTNREHEFNQVKINKSNPENEPIVNINSKLSVDVIRKSFKDIQNILKQKNNIVLATALMMGRVQGFSNGVITIGFTKQYNFHKLRLEKDEYRKTINDIFSEALKERVTVTYDIEDDGEAKEVDKEKMLSDIFPESLVEIYDE